jgi:hypothetical protein
MIGFASDYFGRINVAGFNSLVAGMAALFVWIFGGKNFAGTIVYAMFGAYAGSIWATVGPIGVEVVGIQLLPSGKSFIELFSSCSTQT